MMPDQNGVEATRAIIAAFPEAQIIMLSGRDGEEDIHRAVEAGVRGYLTKASERDEVLVRFYRRAKPLGNWGRIRKLANEEPRSRWGAVIQGIALATAGGGSVMAYITGITRVFIGAFAAGVALLSAALFLGCIFVWRFDPFLRTLLTAEERLELDAAPSAEPDGFGLAGLGAAICFMSGLVLGLYLVLTADYRQPVPAAGAVLLIAAGEYLRRSRSN